MEKSTSVFCLILRKKGICICYRDILVTKEQQSVRCLVHVGQLLCLDLGPSLMAFAMYGGVEVFTVQYMK